MQNLTTYTGTQVSTHLSRAPVHKSNLILKYIYRGFERDSIIYIYSSEGTTPQTPNQ